MEQGLGNCTTDPKIAHWHYSTASRLLKGKRRCSMSRRDPWYVRDQLAEERDHAATRIFRGKHGRRSSTPCRGKHEWRHRLDRISRRKARLCRRARFKPGEVPHPAHRGQSRRHGDRTEPGSLCALELRETVDIDTRRDPSVRGTRRARIGGEERSRMVRLPLQCEFRPRFGTPTDGHIPGTYIPCIQISMRSERSELLTRHTGRETVDGEGKRRQRSYCEYQQTLDKDSMHGFSRCPTFTARVDGVVRLHWTAPK